MAGKKVEIGTVTLTNTMQYPFNNSAQTVALKSPRNSLHYTVQTEVISTAGEAGDILISGKAVNGFKIAYTGSAAQAVIMYYVTGGFD